MINLLLMRSSHHFIARPCPPRPTKLEPANIAPLAILLERFINWDFMLTWRMFLDHDYSLLDEKSHNNKLYVRDILRGVRSEF